MDSPCGLKQCAPRPLRFAKTRSRKVAFTDPCKTFSLCFIADSALQNAILYFFAILRISATSFSMPWATFEIVGPSM